MLLAFCTVLASGCMQQEPETEKEKEELLLWCYWETPKHQRALEELVREFNQDQEDIEVRVQYVPDEDFKKELALALADGRGPELALVDSADFEFFHNAQPFADLTDEVEELQEYMDISLQPCREDGRIYGLPFGLNSTALFYNEEMLEEAGIEVPENWAEFYEAARALTDQEHYGLGMSAIQSEESVYSFLPILWSMGGHVEEIDSKESHDAFTFIRKLSVGGFISSQCINMTLADVKTQFAQGKIAMMINTTASIGALEESNPDLRFGVTEIPADGIPVEAAGGEILGVTAGEHQEEAVRFVKFMADKDRLASYIDEFGVFACRRDIISGQYQDDPLQREAAALLDNARTREFTPEWPGISLSIAAALEETIVGEGPVWQILWDTARQIEEIRVNGL